MDKWFRYTRKQHTNNIKVQLKGMNFLDERKKRKYNKKYNILLVIAGIIILIYILFAIIKLIKSPTDIFIIENGEVSLEESTTGYLIREETVVKGNNYQEGIIQIKSEGEKVAKGEAIFRYYNSDEKQITQQIQEIDKKIDEALSKQTEVLPSDIKSLDKQIEKRVDNICSCTDIEKIKEYKNDIDTYLTKKSKIAGENSPVGSYIKQLYEERSMYESKLSQTTEYVTSPMSGVVSYRVDGLENVLTTSDFSTINKELLQGLRLKTGQIVATNNQEGKVINNFECYIATIMNTDSAKNCKVGQNVKIRLANKEEINASISYKMQEENSDEVIIILKITSKVEDLSCYRKISFDIIWWSDSGLKVPNSAIIYDDNGKAYIIRNRSGYIDKILVKKINETKSYTLVDNYNTDELKEQGYSTEEIKKMKNVTVYDEIISEPKRQILQ